MREFKVDLSESGINKLIDDLNEYKDSLDDKAELFVQKLLDIGITRAESVPGISGSLGTHKFERFVWYSKKLDRNKYGCDGILFGQGRTFNVTWGASGEKSGSINAMMALEFGTAGQAIAPQFKFGVYGGRGTNSFSGYADSDEWYFIDGKELKKATAITPTRPMMQAMEEMISQMNKIAKEVFSQ